MAERSVTHGTFVIERNYPASAEMVFAAFSDPAKKHRWFVDDEASGVEDFGMDFRVGGVERKRFSNKYGVFTNDTVYLDIVPNRRIVFAYTMSWATRGFLHRRRPSSWSGRGKGRTSSLLIRERISKARMGRRCARTDGVCCWKIWRKSWRAD